MAGDCGWWDYETAAARRFYTYIQFDELKEKGGNITSVKITKVAGEDALGGASDWDISCTAEDNRWYVKIGTGEPYRYTGRLPNVGEIGCEGTSYKVTTVCDEGNKDNVHCSRTYAGDYWPTVDLTSNIEDEDTVIKYIFNLYAGEGMDNHNRVKKCLETPSDT